MCVCVLRCCVRFCIHYAFSSCLGGRPKKRAHFSRKCILVCGDCGMATVCVLIGSFNNHPKWQTIGWIKYTCWLNYRCNIFTPTCTQRYTCTHTRRTQHLYMLTMVLQANGSFACMRFWFAFLWSFLMKSSARLIQNGKKKTSKLCRIHAEPYQHQRNWLSWLSHPSIMF